MLPDLKSGIAGLLTVRLPVGPNILYGHAPPAALLHEVLEGGPGSLNGEVIEGGGLAAPGGANVLTDGGGGIVRTAGIVALDLET